MRSQRVRRNLRALWRDTRVLARQFRSSLAAFAIVLCIGTLALRYFYIHPDTNQHLSWAKALYVTFSLVFFENTVPFPQKLGPQILFFVIPPIGLATIADGVLRFGVALFNRRERKEAWQVALASTYRDHVVVCGLGKVGYRVVKELLHLEEEVIGIEHNAEGPFLEEVRQLNVPVLIGDARKRDTLEKAQVQNASAIVVCTQVDLTNLDIALDARELNPSIKVVMRMFDGQLAARVRRGFGIRTAFSTSALAAPVFAAAATRAQIEQSFYVDDVLMNVARTEVQQGSALEEITIAQAEKDFDLSIVLYKSTDTFDPHPAPDIVLHAGDCLVVFASLESLARLRQVSGERPRASSEDTCDSRRPRWITRLFTRDKRSKR